MILKRLIRVKRKSSFDDEKRHKYSMKEYDDTFRIALRQTKLSGIRLTRNDSPTVKFCWEVFYWIFSFTQLGIAAMLEFLNMLDTARGGTFQDAVDIFRMIPCMNYVVLGMVKSFNIVYCRPVFENLVHELRQMWPLRVLTEEEHRIIGAALKHLHTVINVYYWANNVLLAIFLCPPLVDMVRRWLGADLPMVLPFLFMLPFNVYQSGPFECLLILQSWEAMVTIWMLLSGDLLFCVFISHITIQFDLLSIQAKKFVRTAVDKQLIIEYPLAQYSMDMKENNASATELEDIHKRQVKEIVERHQTLIRLSADVEKMFSFPLLLNFVNSSVILCTCGFCVIIVEKWNELSYKFFLTSALTQTWLLCWYGQRLLESSEGLSHAIYNSGWYRVSKGISRSLLIMIHRAQKHVHVTTYGFSVLSLRSYTTIIKTSWSYFTLLLNVYVKK